MQSYSCYCYCCCCLVSSFSNAFTWSRSPAASASAAANLECCCRSCCCCSDSCSPKCRHKAACWLPVGSLLVPETTVLPVLPPLLMLGAAQCLRACCQSLGLQEGSACVQHRCRDQGQKQQHKHDHSVLGIPMLDKIASQLGLLNRAGPQPDAVYSPTPDRTQPASRHLHEPQTGARAHAA